MNTLSKSAITRQKLAIAQLFSDPKLKLVKLSDREYLEGQIAYRSYDNEKNVLLDATLKTIDTKMSSKKRFSILSIGCGSGIFEASFVNQLLTKKSVHFVGVEPKQEECLKTKKWCDHLKKSHPNKFDFEIYQGDFDSFASIQTFDIILFIHSLYYFSEIERSIQESYKLLNQDGMAIVGIAPRHLLNEPYYHVYQRIHGKPAWFSEDVHQVLDKYKLPFFQQKLDFLANITKCFQTDSQLGKQLLDFILGANTTYLSASQRQVILDYFGKIAQHDKAGKILLPHSTSLIYIYQEVKNSSSI